jgi:twinfilin-like protein
LRFETTPEKNVLMQQALYVPEIANVRSKMLYASTRECLKRELGTSLFVAEMHASEKEEMSWAEMQRKTTSCDADRTSVMTHMERMRLVEAPVDTGIERRSYVHGVKYPLSEESETALKSFLDKVCNFVKLKLDKDTESVQLDVSATVDSFDAYRQHVLSDGLPRFSFFRTTPDSAGAVFVYFCPESAKVRDKMMASTAKSAVQAAAEGLGLSIALKLEVRDESDLSEQELYDAPVTAVEPAAPATMARPKGPGSRRGMVKLPGM